ncbi:MAG TPA: helicase-related protein [Ferrovibrio sp.]|uniref:helicase-related protein n=1 Tax=Ferrovibrio sp. TaxID=1917215 RepID=UPI002ED5F01A
MTEIKTAEKGRVLCVLGPTNTGKTHLAVERLLAHRSGIIGLPLRLLAREIYDRAVAIKGDGHVALVTGEEKILPRGAQWFVCTVEAMPLERRYDFLAIDEIQLCSDAERGHVFTDRLLHARGAEETMFLGADTMRGLIRKLVPQAEFIARPRLSALTYAGSKKLSRLPKRSAVVAFSAADVYAIAEQVRRQRGGAAVVLGALSPRARNAQVALFQNRDVDVMVATDAIGMGLNLDIEHLAFAEITKFDGVGVRPLTPAELGQIAGRAGRHLRNGTFGTTADCPPFDPEMIERIENHRFEPITQARWRNTDLDFRSIDGLIRTLELPPPREGLIRAREADDIVSLQVLRQDAQVQARAGARDRIRLLWHVCEIPDFSKSMHDVHARLLTQIYVHLCDHEGRLPADWVAGHLKQIDRTDGDIDTLSQRLAQIRTWTYIANRGDWLDNPAHWQQATRGIEDRLSDALHERLTQRFVDRRTSILTRGLQEDPALLDVTLGEDDALTVEGEIIGHVVGLRFRPVGHDSVEQRRAIRAAANRVLGPALQDHAEKLLQLGDESFALSPEGGVLLVTPEKDSVALAVLAKGNTVLEPKLGLLADDLLPAESRKAVEEKLSDWLRRYLRQHLGDLYRLRDAELKGAARGLAYQLAENLGALKRDDVADLVRNMGQAERHPLRKMGVTFGETHILMPKLLKPKPTQLKTLLWAVAQGKAPEAPPTPGLTSLPILEWRDDAWWLAAGFLRAGRRAFRLDVVQRIAEGARQAEQASRQEAKGAKDAKKDAKKEAKAETKAAEEAAQAEPMQAEPMQAEPLQAAPMPAEPAPEAVEAALAEAAATPAPEQPAETAGAGSLEAAPDADAAELGEAIAQPLEAPAAAPMPQIHPDAPPQPGKEPPGKKQAGPPGSFLPDTAWMNLAGCSAEELQRLLWALGYKPLTAKDAAGQAVTVFIRSQKAIVAKRKREQEKRREDEARMADSPFAALLKLKPGARR